MTEPSASDRSAATELAAAVRRGDRRSIARTLTELERLTPLAAAFIAVVGPSLGAAITIGITGPPGAGKSTLVNALIGAWRSGGARVGVLAVDPSSPVSGGAILGDRIRMTAALDDDGVYVRSLASQGHLGGLSPAAVRMIDGLDAAGFGRIILETVGAGQNEIEVARVADISIVVSAPGLGDGIQAMKAGLLEIADIMVINKADREGAEHTHQQLATALHLQPGRDAVPVIKTIATTGQGIAELCAAIDRIGLGLHPAGGMSRRRRRARYIIEQAASEIVRQRLSEIGPHAWAELTNSVLAGTSTSMAAAEAILAGRQRSIAPKS